jgi:hypothetical protein
LPPGARALASAALGAARPGYRVAASDAAFVARNAAQGFAARFSGAGVTLRAGTLTVGLRLRAAGYGSSLGGEGGAHPRARSNRVVYSRAGLSEWYANLEQGFTLDAPPHGPQAAPLTLSLSLSGNAAATRAADGQSLALAHGGSSLRYGSLLTTDARGRALRTWLELRGRSLLLRVDARGAVYPLQIDPLLQQGGKLVGGGEEGAGAFGVKVALSTDGNTALVGGFGDNGETGAAWVFTRTGSTWTQQGPKLTATEEVGAGEFGTSVALSSDGNTALSGGIFDHGALGAAWAFARSAGSWAPQGPKLTGAGETGNAEFGESVALSADADTALVGGITDSGGKGAAWAFVNPPPSVATGAASGVGVSFATLNGTVSAGASNGAFFQYGTTTAYGSATIPQGLGPSPLARPVTSALGGLSPATTYHYRLVAANSAGQSFGADQTFATTQPTALPPTPPRITAASQAHRLWREGSRLASIARTRRAPVGTTYSFALNEPAHVSLAFTQQASGRKAPGGRCVAQTRRNRGRRACRRTIVRDTLAFGAHAGRNRVVFQGRLSRTRRLVPGAYTLLITARSPEGLTSNTARLGFAIAR